MLDSRLLTSAMQGWPMMPLEELCSAPSSIRPKGIIETRPYIDISSVDASAKTVLRTRLISASDAPSRARQVVSARDIIVATTRPSLNAVAMIPEDQNGSICSTGFCVLRAGAQLEPKYLFWFVQHPDFVRSLSELAQGAMYPAVTDRQVRAQRIPLPPLAEQRRIAAALDAQMETVSRARTAVQRQTTEIDTLRDVSHQRILRVDDELVPLGRLISSTRNGVYKHESFYGDGTPILKMFNIGRFDNRLYLDRLDRVRLTEDELEKARLRKGDILVNRVNSRELVGKCVLIGADQDGWICESKNLRMTLRLDLGSRPVSTLAFHRLS